MTNGGKGTTRGKPPRKGKRKGKCKGEGRAKTNLVIRLLGNLVRLFSLILFRMRYKHRQSLSSPIREKDSRSVPGVGPPNTVSYNRMSSFRSLVCSRASCVRLLIYPEARHQHCLYHKTRNRGKRTSSSIPRIWDSSASFSARSLCSSANASKYSRSSFCSLPERISLFDRG